MTDHTTNSKLGAELSELLLAYTALGRGINTPDMFETTGAVITASLHPGARLNYQRAIAAFHDTATADREPLRQRLKDIEATLADKSETGMGLVGTRSARDDARARLRNEAREIKEALAKLPVVVWEDPEASRTTLMDVMCSKSLYGAVTILDDNCRAARLASKQGTAARIAECGTIHVAAGGEQSALIRSSTGGASIFIAAGSDRPVLNYYATASPDIVDKLGQRITKRGSLLPLAGRAVVIYDDLVDMPEPIIPTDAYAHLLEHYHKLGAKPKAERYTVQFGDTPEEHALWEQFSKVDISEFVGNSESIRVSAPRMEASLRLIVASSFRAVLVGAALRQHRADGNAIILTTKDLKRAKAFTRYLVRQSKALAHIIARRANCVVARDSKIKDDAELQSLTALLHSIIKTNPVGAISRARALQIRGMTAATLDRIAELGSVQILTGNKPPGMPNRTTTAYALPEASEGAVGVTMANLKGVERAQFQTPGYDPGAPEGDSTGVSITQYQCSDVVESLREQQSSMADALGPNMVARSAGMSSAFAAAYGKPKDTEPERHMAAQPKPPMPVFKAIEGMYADNKYADVIATLLCSPSGGQIRSQLPDLSGRSYTRGKDPFIIVQDIPCGSMEPIYFLRFDLNGRDHSEEQWTLLYNMRTAIACDPAAEESFQRGVDRVIQDGLVESLRRRVKLSEISYGGIVLGLPMLMLAEVGRRQERGTSVEPDSYTEEKLAEYESACNNIEECDPAALVLFNNRVTAMAEQNDKEHGLPCVPITHLEARDMHLIPHLIVEYAGSVALRGTADKPEPAHLLEPLMGEETPFIVKGVPNIWTRYSKAGTPLRRWDRSNLGFPEWADK